MAGSNLRRNRPEGTARKTAHVPNKESKKQSEKNPVLEAGPEWDCDLFTLAVAVGFAHK